jgi:hypothetical protein
MVLLGEFWRCPHPTASKSCTPGCCPGGGRVGFRGPGRRWRDRRSARCFARPESARAIRARRSGTSGRYASSPRPVLEPAAPTLVGAGRTVGGTGAAVAGLATHDVARTVESTPRRFSCVCVGADWRQPEELLSTCRRIASRSSSFRDRLQVPRDHHRAGARPGVLALAAAISAAIAAWSTHVT